MINKIKDNLLHALRIYNEQMIESIALINLKPTEENKKAAAKRREMQLEKEMKYQKEIIEEYEISIEALEKQSNE